MPPDTIRGASTTPSAATPNSCTYVKELSEGMYVLAMARICDTSSPMIFRPSWERIFDGGTYTDDVAAGNTSFWNAISSFNESTMALRFGHCTYAYSLP